MLTPATDQGSRGFKMLRRHYVQASKAGARARRLQIVVAQLSLSQKTFDRIEFTLTSVEANQWITARQSRRLGKGMVCIIKLLSSRSVLLQGTYSGIEGELSRIATKKVHSVPRSGESAWPIGEESEMR
ncbi:60S ribosomal protein L5 [Striga asiatica]|uniref:60S ribosomal protein L5 n=1 Tax=Striga asiatica TaxID=4170 RepID=A0A5A7QBD3_STRAF|nr:60S ribosomal protein L5 [Striga asiatica]